METLKNNSLEQHNAGYCNSDMQDCQFCQDCELTCYYEEPDHGLPF